MVKNSLGEYDDCSIEFCAINYLGKKYCSIFTVQSTFVWRSGHHYFIEIFSSKGHDCRTPNLLQCKELVETFPEHAQQKSHKYAAGVGGFLNGF